MDGMNSPHRASISTSLSIMWPSYCRQGTYILDETNLALVIDVD